MWLWVREPSLQFRGQWIKESHVHLDGVYTGNPNAGDGTGWIFWVASIEERKSVSVLMRERQTKHLAARERSWWSLVQFTKHHSSPTCRHVVESHTPLSGPERMCEAEST